MQFYYGDKLPLRILDEAEFWKRQEKEHTIVIREIASDLEEEYVSSLKKWEEAFAETEGLVIRMIENVIRSHELSSKTYQDINQLIKFSTNQSRQFVYLLNHILKNSKTIADNVIAITVINHIRRESEYYIGITNAFLYD